MALILGSTSLYLLKASDPDSAADCLSLQMAIERLKAALELQKRDWRESYLEFYIGMEISHLVSRLIFFKMFDQIEYFTDHLIDLVNPNYTNLEGKKRPDRPWAANLAHSILGHKALVKGDLDQAKRCFVKLQEYPESTYNDALCALAEGLAEAGELDMVITYYEKQCESLCCRLAQPDLNPFQRSRLETHLKSKIQAIQHLSRQRKK